MSKPSESPGSVIPQDVLHQIKRLSEMWAEQNDCPRPSSMHVVATTFDAAVPRLYPPAPAGDKAKGSPPRPIYLVVLSGSFTLHQARHVDTASLLTGSWAALIMSQSQPLHVESVTLRPAPPESFSLHSLGRVYSIAL